jgi:hypothetical protein
LLYVCPVNLCQRPVVGIFRASSPNAHRDSLKGMRPFSMRPEAGAECLQRYGKQRHRRARGLIRGARAYA